MGPCATVACWCADLATTAGHFSQEDEAQIDFHFELHTPQKEKAGRAGGWKLRSSGSSRPQKIRPPRSQESPNKIEGAGISLFHLRSQLFGSFVAYCCMHGIISNLRRSRLTTCADKNACMHATLNFHSPAPLQAKSKPIAATIAGIRRRQSDLRRERQQEGARLRAAAKKQRRMIRAARVQH